MTGVLGTSTILAAPLQDRLRAPLQKKGGKASPCSVPSALLTHSPAISGIIARLSLVTSHLSLFVYGTLRRGGKRHDILQLLHAAYVGKGSVAGELFDLGEYPGAVKSNATAARVIGEVYRLPNLKTALRTLDEYEGVGAVASLYRRDVTEVTLESGQRLSAWVYWLNEAPPRARRIESGDYAGGRKP